MCLYRDGSLLLIGSPFWGCGACFNSPRFLAIHVFNLRHIRPPYSGYRAETLRSTPKPICIILFNFSAENLIWFVFHQNRMHSLWLHFAFGGLQISASFGRQVKRKLRAISPALRSPQFSNSMSGCLWE
ncbi:hypothetical protein B0H10DRAFT_2050718 [Mycena sp. CBHHK59/15]|nr:hypothetical protein B0H10DRAFT_2050718 [Mycena sp. CBHHK59/15]